MNFIKKIILCFKYRKKNFLFLGLGSSYQQFNSKFLYPNNISLGKYSKISDFAHFDGVGGIKIGECTIIGPKVTILTSNHNYHEKYTDYLPFDNTLIRKSVEIGDYCWVGMGVLILPGVKIGTACVVGAGSVVTKNIESYSVVGGNPAQVLRKRDASLINQLIARGRCVANQHENPNPSKLYV